MATNRRTSQARYHLSLLLIPLITGCTLTPPTPESTSPVSSLMPGQRFYLQLFGVPEVPADAEVVILDGADTPETTVRQLTESGTTVLCYINAGAIEDWRSDAEDFRPSLIGRPLTDWPGERWLDIRQRDQLAPIMATRMDECLRKGFAGVDPDNVDGYVVDTGFELAPADAAAYEQMLAALAHERGLLVGLKNAVEIIPEVAGVVDFAVNEQCLQLGECDAYATLARLKKPILHVEYGLPYEQVCAAQLPGFSSVVADQGLGAGAQMCRP
ncbi:MAG: endo alpha-1,4 polygalactosaminidase [Propioniciclava sp.]